MLTPQEVSEKCFSKATFGGYDMGEVDDFLDSLTEDYTALYKENALLKSKMKLLVEKVEEYRSSEEDMRKAIDAAKSMANQIMEDARRKGAELEKAAMGREEQEIAALRAEIDAEKSRLEQAKLQTAEFIAEMKRVLRAEAELLSNIKDLPTVSAHTEPVKNPQSEPAVAAMASVKAVPAEDPVEDAVKSIEDSVAKMVGEVDISNTQTSNEFAAPEFQKAEKSREEILADIQRETAELFKEPDFPEKPRKRPPLDPELEETRPKFNFTDLRFGKDYEIK